MKPVRIPRATQPDDAPPGIVDCPGMKITRNAGISFTDHVGRVHDLEKQIKLGPKEAARDPRMLGSTHIEILALIRRGELYPVFKRNDRVILIFDCALTDWQARQLVSQPLRHLAQTRAEKVA